MKTVSAYVSAGSAWPTDFGSEVFEPVAEGTTIELVSPPAHGTLDLATAPRSWRYTADAGAPAGSTDSWRFRPVVNGVPGDTADVAVELYSID